MSSTLVWHSHPVDQQSRARQKSQEPLVIWFTGIDSPYDAPVSPEVHIDAEGLNVAASVNQLLEYLHSSGVLKAGYLPVSISA